MTRSWLRIFLGPALLLVVYLILLSLFAVATRNDGLLNPGHLPRLDLALLGLGVILLRLAVLVLVPTVLAYRLVERLLSDQVH